MAHILMHTDKMLTGELADFKWRASEFAEMLKAASLSHPEPSIRRNALHLMLNWGCA